MEARQDHNEEYAGCFELPEGRQTWVDGLKEETMEPSLHQILAEQAVTVKLEIVGCEGHRQCRTLKGETCDLPASSLTSPRNFITVSGTNWS